MHASYTGKKSRSFSTTDVYRIADGQQQQQQQQHQRDDDIEDVEMPPPMQLGMSFSTLGRALRRPTTRPPPAPPRRAGSFCSTTTKTTELSMTGMRSYLSDDIRRQFALTASQASTNSSRSSSNNSSNSSSPRSSNFVKKLVATLERRQKENAVSPCKTNTVASGCTINHDFYQRSFHEFNQDDKCSIADAVEPTLYPPVDFLTRYRAKQLQQLHETEEVECDDFDSSDPEDYFPERRRNTSSDSSNGSGSNRPTPIICSAQPAACSTETVDKSKPSGKRSLKNVISSLLNWRIGTGKNLPKGSREYYNSRESLGEEMRAFRRDTMPELMERAAFNSRLPDLLVKQAGERPRRETQDFAKLFKRPGNVDGKRHEEPSPHSVATIHPVYGSSRALASSQLQLAGRGPVSERLYSARFHHEPPAMFQPPAIFALPPPRVCNSSPAAPSEPTASYSDEHLLRPSRLKDLQKRLSLQRGIDCNIAAAVQMRSSLNYDVPRSNRPVVVQEYRVPPPATIHYQNISQTNGQDNRLSCTLFTTF